MLSSVNVVWPQWREKRKVSVGYKTESNLLLIIKVLLSKSQAVTVDFNGLAEQRCLLSCAAGPTLGIVSCSRCMHVSLLPEDAIVEDFNESIMTNDGHFGIILSSLKR
ncbi:hypothetical protein XENORESO_004201 [Xenotaenia resolanae]|uniref:Uncharacterized protein n=1 Tax=Xenotaenia resolanae TaxID=208358 RepID=A0ABV0WAG3_9TELE